MNHTNDWIKYYAISKGSVELSYNHWLEPRCHLLFKVTIEKPEQYVKSVQS